MDDRQKVLEPVDEDVGAGRLQQRPRREAVRHPDRHAAGAAAGVHVVLVVPHHHRLSGRHAESDAGLHDDGRVRLQFLPEGKRSADTNVGLLVSRFHQPFGQFKGTLGDGNQVWELENVSGFTEEHYAKW